MDKELIEAIALYQANLAELSDLEDSEDLTEVLQLKAQLQEALKEALEALDGLQGQQADIHEPHEPVDQEVEAVARPVAAAPLAMAPAKQRAATQLRVARPGDNNARIHPSSRYAHEQPDFQALAELYPALRPHLRAGSFDFTSPDACRELTAALLHHDFGLRWALPPGQLVPPLTNRTNYIHWLQDLLALSSPPEPVIGLDVGCGANLIYPLLGATICGWRFVAADVTATAVAWARRNRDANPQVAHMIDIRRVAMQPEQAAFHVGAAAEQEGGEQHAAGGSSSSGKDARMEGQNSSAAGVAAETAGEVGAAGAASPGSATRHEPERRLQQQGAVGTDLLPPAGAAGDGIVSGALRQGERVAFCMCNPPFFESMEEAGRNPATAYGGTAEEMVYPGGELAFVTSMIQDSLTIRGQVHWYTTMVGKKSTLKAARSLLYRHGVRVLRTTEFCQGKTSRWALAWSLAAHPSVASLPLPRRPNATLDPKASGERQAERGAVAYQTSAAGRQAAGAALRAAAAAAPAARPCRQVSWQVRGTAAAGPEILAAMQAALQEQGVVCQADKATYTLRLSYQPSAQELAAVQEAAAGRAAKRPRREGANEQPAQGQPWNAELRLFMQHAGAFAVTGALLTAASAAAQAWFGGAMGAVRQVVAVRWKASV